MSVDLLGTSWDQCRSMVQYSFTSTETRRLVRTDSSGRPPRLSHSSWTMITWAYVIPSFILSRRISLIISPSRFMDVFLSTRMMVKSYGLVGAPMAMVKECTGHTCHPQHHVLWYLFHQPPTAISLKVTYEFDIHESPQLARTVFNRIAPQGSHRYCRRGHNTIVLHTVHNT